MRDSPCSQLLLATQISKLGLLSALLGRSQRTDIGMSESGRTNLHQARFASSTP